MLRRLVRAGAAAVLMTASVAGALFLYVNYCRWSRLDVLPIFRYSRLARAAFEDRDFDRLLDVLMPSQEKRFATVWDTSQQVTLDSRQFEPTEMYGQGRYRYRPSLRLVTFTVWTGLEHRSFGTLDTEALKWALGRCRVERLARFETDEYGLVRSGFTPDAGTPTVLFLGDSFTQGLLVPGTATFVARFGRRLHEAGILAAAVNAGVDGYGALEYAWTAERHAARLDSRVVIANLYLNDVHEDDRAVMEGRVPERRYREMFGWLDRLRSQCRAEGRSLIVSVIPHKDQVASPDDPRRFQVRVAAWCVREGVPFLDPIDRFRRSGGQRLYFRWDPHFSEEGHRVYAEFLLEQLLPVLRRAFGIKG